jgi:hypothetical protein
VFDYGVICCVFVLSLSGGRELMFDERLTLGV